MKRAAGGVLACLLLVGCGSSHGATAPVVPDAGSKMEAAARTSAVKDAGVDASSADAGREAAPPVDAGVDAPIHVAPLSGPSGQWTWIDLPGTACLDGSETGFAINPAPMPSKDILIFIEGGGACWDGTSCWGPVSTSFYVATGYGQVEFDTDPQVDLYILDRANSANPFASMNLIFIPYCTGDVFAGDNVTTLTYLGTPHETHFVGWDNMTIYLQYIAATYGDAANVWLGGDSAGGFGAALNFGHVQDALPSATVQVLDDSGQPIQPAPGTWPTWISAWNLQLPAGCPACQTDPGAFVAYYATTYPNQRFGLISYQYDTVISTFMGLTLTQFNTELLALAAQMDTSWPDGHYFILAGASHVGLLAPTPELQTWIQQMVTGDPSWGSSQP